MHGARVGATTAAFAQTDGISAIKLACGWKIQQSAEAYIQNGRAEIAALNILPENQARIMKSAERFSRLLNQYIETNALTLSVDVRNPFGGI